MTEKGAAFLSEHFLQMAREDKSVQRVVNREVEGVKLDLIQGYWKIY